MRENISILKDQRFECTSELKSDVLNRNLFLPIGFFIYVIAKVKHPKSSVGI